MAKFNQIILLVCVLIIVATIPCQADMEKYKEFRENTRKICQEKNKVTVELMDGLSNGKFPDGNKELKCFTACAMEQMKSMKDGKLDKAAALSVIETDLPENLREGAKKALTVCAAKHESLSDPCELAWEMVKCWKNEDPTFTFM